MPDFSSSGIWDEDDCGIMIELEDLNIPYLLKLMFIDWIELYEECWDHSYTFMYDEKSKLMNKRGLQLAKQLKKYYKDVKIIYKGESDAGLHGDVEI